MKYNFNIASVLLLASCLSVTGQNTLPPDQFRVLTREHTDGLCILYDAAANSNQLSLVAWERDAELDLPTKLIGICFLDAPRFRENRFCVEFIATTLRFLSRESILIPIPAGKAPR